MRRLAVLFAVLATMHVTEVLVTPQRVDSAATATSRVWGVLRTLWLTVSAPNFRRLLNHQPQESISRIAQGTA